MIGNHDRPTYPLKGPRHQQRAGWPASCEAASGQQQNNSPDLQRPLQQPPNLHPFPPGHPTSQRCRRGLFLTHLRSTPPKKLSGAAVVLPPNQVWRTGLGALPNHLEGRSPGFGVGSAITSAAHTHSLSHDAHTPRVITTLAKRRLTSHTPPTYLLRSPTTGVGVGEGISTNQQT